MLARTLLMIGIKLQDYLMIRTLALTSIINLVVVKRMYHGPFEDDRGYSGPTA